MSLELVCGMFAILSATVSIITAVTKINRAIVVLEEAVKNLNAFAREQRAVNDEHIERIRECEIRLASKDRGGIA